MLSAVTADQKPHSQTIFCKLCQFILLTTSFSVSLLLIFQSKPSSNSTKILAHIHILCKHPILLAELLMRKWICFSVYEHVLSHLFFSNKLYDLVITRLHLFLLIYQHYNCITLKVLDFTKFIK